MFLMSAKELAPMEDQGVIFGILDASANSTLDQNSLFSAEVNRVFMSVPETDFTFQLIFHRGRDRASTLRAGHRPGGYGPETGHGAFRDILQRDGATAFDRAMRYQHSFWYAHPGKFTRRRSRPTRNAPSPIGVSRLSLLDNPHGAIPAPNLPLGLAAIEKAKAIGAKTERERDYIDALAVMYVDYDKTPQPARVQSYLKKMEALAAKYPDDDEAQISTPSP